MVDDWLKDGKYIKRMEWDDDQYAALDEEFSFYLTFEEESDRAAAVLAHARFEDWLLGRIRAEFGGVDDETAKRLDVFGLSEASGRRSRSRWRSDGSTGRSMTA